ncbi:hypothetical protein BKA93DRAFT_828711 [Sparassis latifolia]|uniref:MYND-type domain-containing protein n=1 Tax=Sparassis crispa TaxID=139825 RepID=A0A401H513_9APHY|nr:hypothetical protein SCP_1601970 [Sparassis crispa]GBE89535.1 hypothetical protein SCP_1601970 [Sparassis crispa]
MQSHVSPEVMDEVLNSPEMMAKIYWTEEPNRECSGCGKRKSPTVILKKCSGCYWKEYCSSECQKKDWPVHKTICRERQATRRDLEEIQKGMWTDIYDWIPRHRQPMFDALMAALNLRHHPHAHEDFFLELELVYNAQEKTVRRRFELQSAAVRDWQTFLDNDYEGFFARRYADRLQFDEESKKHPGGYGCAYAIISMVLPGGDSRLFTDVPYRLNVAHVTGLAYGLTTWRTELARDLEKSAGRQKGGKKKAGKK